MAPVLFPTFDSFASCCQEHKMSIDILSTYQIDFLSVHSICCIVVLLGHMFIIFLISFKILTELIYIPLNGIQVILFPSHPQEYLLNFKFLKSHFAIYSLFISLRVWFSFT